MAKHLDTNGVAIRTQHTLFVNLLVYFGHLFHVQLARQHNHICKLGVKLQRVDVGYVQLCGKVNLNAHLPTIHHYGHVASDNGRHLRFFGGVYDGVHRSKVVAIDNGINR